MGTERVIITATACGVVGGTALLAVAAALWVYVTVEAYPANAPALVRVTWCAGRLALIIGLMLAGGAVLGLSLVGVGRLALWLAGAR